ncbi:GNAT family N-acetyltransferase [Ornithinimicrobium sp. F0845]|uniref:GNAT family N-acetyltransferase n=1 Tax=Ornithinimicrobium sp. F0845 TaxID=2926412 RepID=UPI001FF51CAE|nr:GNAT family N-acetyltransferase [Ornithinimicrobium sp. F0845]MCK0113694.1 GNAT family N-acetyltransferase [Ornithinimicrobium sp. F0845]
MSEISVRVLQEEDWPEYRDVRLRALKESPEAFVASAAEEEDYDEDRWRSRMQRSRRLLAEQDETVVGVVSVGSHKIETPGAGELFGLWVDPAKRGSGVARKLLEAAAAQARADDLKHLIYWVGTDNGRAVAFASSFGFRPTDNRRPMEIHGVDDAEDAEELAMVLPLGNSSGVPTSL